MIASHSSSRALTNHPRNMTDDMLRALASNGGVVMVNFNAAFVDENLPPAPGRRRSRSAKRRRSQEQKDRAEGKPFTFEEEESWRRSGRRRSASAVQVLIDHIDHMAKVAGVDHVGLGSDFDGVAALPEGMDSVADLPKITQALVERGYTAEQITRNPGREPAAGLPRWSR